MPKTLAPNLESNDKGLSSYFDSNYISLTWILKID